MLLTPQYLKKLSRSFAVFFVSIVTRLDPKTAIVIAGIKILPINASSQINFSAMSALPGLIAEYRKRKGI